MRLGGEEFCVMMPDTDIDLALCQAEAARDAVEKLELFAGGEQVRVTTSIGVGMINAGHDSVRALTMAADQALYDAKKNGRNRVVKADVAAQCATAAV